MRGIDADTLARDLMWWGRLARRMPPAWDGAHVAPPLVGSQGERLGRMLLGRGLLIDHDLRALGITRAVPYVFERGPVLKVHDRIRAATQRLGIVTRCYREEIAAVALLAAMTKISGLGGYALSVPLLGAFSSLEDMVLSGMKGRTMTLPFNKNSITTTSLKWHSSFLTANNPPPGSYTNIPGGAAMHSQSTGAISGPVPVTAERKYLLSFMLSLGGSKQAGALVDILVAAGNLSAASNTVNSTALTRNYTPDYGGTPGPGIFATFDTTTAAGASVGNLQMSSYTDQDGNAAAASASQAVQASAIIRSLQPGNAPSFPIIDLASGDFGVRSVETVTIGGTLGGYICALNLIYVLAFMTGMNAGVATDISALGQFGLLQELPRDGSDRVGCLAYIYLANTTTSGSDGGRVLIGVG